MMETEISHAKAEGRHALRGHMKASLTLGLIFNE
jgi:hypothetical protein